MTIQTWPESLPKPERSTWQRAHQDVRRKRTPEAGVPSYRPGLSKSYSTVTLSVVLDRNQKAIFDLFYHDDCRDGALMFWMPDPTTDGWPLLTSEGVPMLTSEGVPLLLSAQWLCLWGDALPVETIVGQVEFRMTFDVKVVPE
ncbi:hypothetical protein [Celeribacter baekdonensis]|uniref:hypothetical protein n=1 Tax=Celeribacter baekdonensis TaxID=875171 RepID=UPI0030D6E89A|tara:strand:- start:7017 stop:7445 length:429 start_codon:yes stop_codon:yes gene_type:complete